jgi:ketosteroid isomerase-like protein
MNHDAVQKWLDSYVAAWRSNDVNAIGALFSEDAIHSYRPWTSDKHTVTGRDAIVASWLDSPDDPSSWDAHYEPYVVEGNRAVAVGWSKYHATDDDPERLYHNAYLLQFDDDAVCSEFREFYFLED